jgi:hypothetical protein
MRTPFVTDAFDRVFNLFTSFGYFDDAAGNLGVVAHDRRLSIHARAARHAH